MIPPVRINFLLLILLPQISSNTIFEYSGTSTPSTLRSNKRDLILNKKKQHTHIRTHKKAKQLIKFGKLNPCVCVFYYL